MKRRSALKVLAGSLSAPVVLHATTAKAHIVSNPNNNDEFRQALESFTQINPGQSSVSLTVHDPDSAYRFDHLGTKPLFVGSAVKTYILGQYLLDVETGKLDENERLQVGPAVWSPGGDVLVDVQGTIPARNVLEMMIAHSDNTSTDMAIKQVGPARVRELIKKLGLHHTQIPDSTRVLFSYLNGAPSGKDMGWDGMQAMEKGESFGPIRDPINPDQTMMSTAEEMRAWYDYVLSGKLFKDENTLKEFKRISAMANAIPSLMPDGIMGYGKGGSIIWNDFNCFTIAGQMVIPGTRTVNFCFITNWSGAESTIAPTFAQFVKYSTEMIHSLA
tara:strand:+ start:709 stop:1701 length:993 start_codon:yes stop_codon:yes gene_type:complete